jgi:chromosome segregation ATPase
MKIRSNSINPETIKTKEDFNALKNAEIKKEVLPDTKNQQLAGQLATTVKSEQSLASMTRATELHNSVATAKTGILSSANSVEEKLKHLGTKLDSLKNEKQGLMVQIKATGAEIMGAELAHDYSAVAAASTKLAELKSRLANVDLEIKSILSEIDKLEQQQKEEKDRVENQQEMEGRIDANLQKASDARKQILDAID